MKKRIVFALIFSILLLLLPPFFYFYTGSDLTVGDVEALEKQIYADYIEKYYPDTYPHQKPSEFDTFRYYGTDNGYHIILLRPAGVHTADSYVNDIAGYPFDLGAGLQLKAYKNGKFIDLEIAHLFRLVGTGVIAEASRLHAERKNATD